MRKRKLILFLSLAAGFPHCARAQFSGYVSPQSVVQTLANTVACTGFAQTFSINNLGQTQHFATISANNTNKLQMEIDGVDGMGNSTRISDVLDNAQQSPTPTTITGGGFFPIIRIKVTCSGTSSNFTVLYSGSSATYPSIVGGFQAAQIDKTMFLNLPANATQSDQLQPPFGSSAGVLEFTYQTAAVAGSTLTVSCSGNIVSTFAYTFSPANVMGTLQTFQIPASPCINLQVQYASGGATAGTIIAEYIFSAPGTQTSVDPCASGTSTSTGKTSSAISAAAIATTLLVGAGAGTATIYPCGIQGSMSAAGAFQLVYGTGATCGTGTTALTGVETTLSGTPILIGTGGQTILSVPLGKALCIVTSVAGGFNGSISYVQQ